MTLNVYRSGNVAQIEENGYSTLWSLQVGTDQIDYVIKSLQDIKLELEFMEDMGKIITLESSNLATVHYNQDEQLLRVRFKSGALYQYSEVPLSVYFGLLKAESHGKFLEKYIKENYKVKKITLG